MILLLTNSHDVTTDILMPYLTERAEVFRFNIDLWREYTWSIGPDGYTLTDPTGRTCREREVGAVYERKVMFDPPTIDTPAGGSPEAWLREEVFRIWAGIKDLAYGSGKLALIHPSPSGNWYKMRQMRAAKKYFPVLSWEMLRGVPTRLKGTCVAKTNGGQSLGQNRLFVVKQVDPATLDTSYPWFLQRAGEAKEEVTVAYIAGRTFASSLSRAELTEADCRPYTFQHGEAWQPCELTPDEHCAVCALMRETGLSFARLDFLRIRGKLHFLELNPNGQFGWLDLRNERGMLTAVVDEIMRVHDLNLPAPQPATPPHHRAHLNPADFVKLYQRYTRRPQNRKRHTADSSLRRDILRTLAALLAVSLLSFLAVTALLSFCGV